MKAASPRFREKYRAAGVMGARCAWARLGASVRPVGDGVRYVTRLVAHAAILNGRGNGALRKLGARQTGMRPQGLKRHGMKLDQHIWRLTRDDWWGALTLASHRPTLH